MIGKRTAMMIAAATACSLAAGVARAAPPGKPRVAGHPPTAAEFAALKQRVEQQDELIIRLTQLESEHYEMLVKLLREGRPGQAHVSLPTLPPPPVAVPKSTPAAAQPAQPGPPVADAEADNPQPGTSHARLGSITGRVDVKGKTRGPIYVYVENIKEAAVERRIEIVQKDRAFVPAIVVAQRGTSVSFPNSDPVLHNVFSPSPTQPFDLGSYRQGDRAGQVRLFKTGVVEVFCNMHSKMRADLLVVPNRHYAKVNPDGSFRLDNVPIGSRQVAAWTPDAPLASETVTLTAAGATVRLGLQTEARAHNRKDGTSYGSYEKE
jgi:plastocyanin